MTDLERRPPIEHLQECFDLQGDTLRWKVRPMHHFKTASACKGWNGKYAGTEPGASDENRKSLTISVSYEGVRYQIRDNRLKFTLREGRYPESLVDPQLVREITVTQKVRKSISSRELPLSGYRGVTHQSGSAGFAARIYAGRQLCLGTFDTPEEAHAAYAAAAIRLRVLKQ